MAWEVFFFFKSVKLKVSDNKVVHKKDLKVIIINLMATECCMKRILNSCNNTLNGSRVVHRKDLIPVI